MFDGFSFEEEEHKTGATPAAEIVRQRPLSEWERSRSSAQEQENEIFRCDVLEEMPDLYPKQTAFGQALSERWVLWLTRKSDLSVPSDFQACSESHDTGNSLRPWICRMSVA